MPRLTSFIKLPTFLAVLLWLAYAVSTAQPFMVVALGAIVAYLVGDLLTTLTAERKHRPPKPRTHVEKGGLLAGALAGVVTGLFYVYRWAAPLDGLPGTAVVARWGWALIMVVAGAWLGQKLVALLRSIQVGAVLRRRRTRGEWLILLLVLAGIALALWQTLGPAPREADGRIPFSAVFNLSFLLQTAFWVLLLGFVAAGFGRFLLAAGGRLLLLLLGAGASTRWFAVIGAALTGFLALFLSGTLSDDAPLALESLTPGTILVVGLAAILGFLFVGWLLGLTSGLLRRAVASIALGTVLLFVVSTYLLAAPLPPERILLYGGVGGLLIGLFLLKLVPLLLLRIVMGLVAVGLVVLFSSAASLALLSLTGWLTLGTVAAALTLVWLDAERTQRA